MPAKISPAKQPPSILTPAQLAERWQCTADYLYRAVLGAPDGVPAFRIGSQPRSPLRIRLADVEEFERRNAVCYGSKQGEGEAA